MAGIEQSNLDVFSYKIVSGRQKNLIVMAGLAAFSALDSIFRFSR